MVYNFGIDREAVIIELDNELDNELDDELDDELDEICQNCTNFIQHPDDVMEWLGICLNDPEFEPFLEEILEYADFSGCYDLYLEKRFSGEKEPCDLYDQIELDEMAEDWDFYNHINVEQIKQANVDEVIAYLYNSDNRMVNKAISFISPYVAMQNKDAYEGLINYYMSLGPAVSLEDVYTRKKIVDAISVNESEQKTIEAYVNELYRTPSNNTTRQLYTSILYRLERCPQEMTREPLLDLLEKKKYSYKMNKRITDIIWAEERYIWE